MVSSQLIPGLPNDVSVLCLLRLPAQELVRVQKVSSLWRIAIQSDRFYVERRRRQPFPSIFAICRMPHAYQCLDADIADLENPRLLFSCDVLQGHKLFPPDVVFVSVDTCVYGFAPGQHVQQFSLLTRRWTQHRKLFSHGRRLMISAVGRHVVVIVCRKQKYDIDDDDDDNEGLGSDDGNTGSEILDTHTNEWTCLEGLPDEFHAMHCITYQGTVYVKGKTGDDPPAVYGLDLTKRSWAKDTHLSAMLDSVHGDSKIILQPTSVLLATSFQDMIKVRHLFVSTGVSIEVLSLATVSTPCSYFLFRQNEQIFLAVQGEASSWHSKKAFFYHRLNILYIPGDLLMVDAIPGQAVTN
ncbi:hypothetical protein L7F22_058263 [Adiantum nelumboides]|nr:hypothetical protein [Adiantum nelumboides]